jgi:hypothetical protein
MIGGTAIAVRNHNHVDLLPPISAEAIEVCIPIGSNKVLPTVFIDFQVMPAVMHISLNS